VSLFAEHTFIPGDERKRTLCVESGPAVKVLGLEVLEVARVGRRATAGRRVLAVGAAARVQASVHRGAHLVAHGLVLQRGQMHVCNTHHTAILVQKQVLVTTALCIYLYIRNAKAHTRTTQLYSTLDLYIQLER
jgi:hypothetical protein